MGKGKEPYIKEKSVDPIEDTNSFLLDEEMLVDDSNSKIKNFEESLENKLDFDLDNLDSYVEMKETEEKVEPKEEKMIEKKETPKRVSKHENKKRKKAINTIIVALCFIPFLIVFSTIGFHSNELVIKPLHYISLILLGVMIVLLIIGIISCLKTSKTKVKSATFKIVFSIFMFFYAVGSGTFLFLLYGPFSGFRNWLIPTAMTTMTHQYLATWFYSNDTVENILSQNAIIESGEDTDLNLITVGKIDFNTTTYANEYEKEILTKNSENDVYKIINIEGSGYKGYLVAVYDPSRVGVATTKYLNVKGQYVTDMAAANKVLLATNGGGFVDPNYSGAGGTPQGIVIKDGKIISNRSYSKSGGLIGLTKDNKLVLGKMTANEAINKGVRDAVTFGPFLIVNGKRSFIKGNGGWGTAPRTAIGQRKDGIILLLVIDGRTLKYPGADMVDLTDIMENYGAYNAANLDGGTSSVMVFPESVSKNYLNEKELKSHCRNSYCYINDPIDGGGSHETRWVATSIIVK